MIPPVFDLLEMIPPAFDLLEMVPPAFDLLEMALKEGPIFSKLRKHNQVAETKLPLVRLSANCFFVLTYLMKVPGSSRIRSKTKSRLIR